jgi:glycosyltransferase involved in cell wall biosynthesis
MKNIINYKISVIIASLGGEILTRTVELLNNSTLKPDEIIVVIPDEYKKNIPLRNFTNLRYELVSFKGQVAQRAHGFKLAKNEYVLQLDDDIYLNENCLENLLYALVILGNNHSVGPVILYKATGKSVYSLGTGLNKFLLNIKSYFLSGSLWGSNRMGTISKNGVGFGFDNEILLKNFNKSEWLAGGCILHFQSCLIYDNYFPFYGKAYGEDLIHSYYLNNANIKLYSIKNAICFIDSPVITEETYSLYSDFRSRLYLNKLRKVSSIYIYFWYYSRKLYYKLLKIKFLLFESSS